MIYSRVRLWGSLLLLPVVLTACSGSPAPEESPLQAEQFFERVQSEHRGVLLDPITQAKTLTQALDIATSELEASGALSIPETLFPGGLDGEFDVALTSRNDYSDSDLLLSSSEVELSFAAETTTTSFPDPSALDEGDEEASEDSIVLEPSATSLGSGSLSGEFRFLGNAAYALLETLEYDEALATQFQELEVLEPFIGEWVLLTDDSDLQGLQLQPVAPLEILEKSQEKLSELNIWTLEEVLPATDEAYVYRASLNLEDFLSTFIELSLELSDGGEVSLEEQEEILASIAEELEGIEVAGTLTVAKDDPLSFLFDANLVNGESSAGMLVLEHTPNRKSIDYTDPQEALWSFSAVRSADSDDTWSLSFSQTPPAFDPETPPTPVQLMQGTVSDTVFAIDIQQGLLSLLKIELSRDSDSDPWSGSLTSELANASLEIRELFTDSYTVFRTDLEIFFEDASIATFELRSETEPANLGVEILPPESFTSLDELGISVPEDDVLLDTLDASDEIEDAEDDLEILLQDTEDSSTEEEF